MHKIIWNALLLVFFFFHIFYEKLWIHWIIVHCASWVCIKNPSKFNWVPILCRKFFLWIRNNLLNAFSIWWSSLILHMTFSNRHIYLVRVRNRRMNKNRNTNTIKWVNEPQLFLYCHTRMWMVIMNLVFVVAVAAFVFHSSLFQYIKCVLFLSLRSKNEK